MNKVIFFLFIFICSFHGIYAQEVISSSEAKDNIGRSVQVKGKVANIFISQKGNTFINFDNKSPNQTFTAFIPAEKSFDISNITEGCTLTVFGEIKEYKGIPEIILENKEQIIAVE